MYHLKLFQEAASLFLKAIEANPEESNAYSGLGWAHLKMGQK